MTEDELKTMGILALVGVFLGIGQYLASGDPINLRLALGRAMISGGLGLCAGAILVFFQDVPLPALVGVAAVLASLGTSALERMFQHYFPVKNRGK